MASSLMTLLHHQYNFHHRPHANIGFQPSSLSPLSRRRGLPKITRAHPRPITVTLISGQGSAETQKGLASDGQNSIVTEAEDWVNRKAIGPAVEIDPSTVFRRLFAEKQVVSSVVAEKAWPPPSLPVKKLPTSRFPVAAAVALFVLTVGTAACFFNWGKKKRNTAAGDSDLGIPKARKIANLGDNSVNDSSIAHEASNYVAEIRATFIHKSEDAHTASNSIVKPNGNTVFMDRNIVESSEKPELSYVRNKAVQVEAMPIQHSNDVQQEVIPVHQHVNEILRGDAASIHQELPCINATVEMNGQGLNHHARTKTAPIVSVALEERMVKSSRTNSDKEYHAIASVDSTFEHHATLIDRDMMGRAISGSRYIVLDGHPLHQVLGSGGGELCYQGSSVLVSCSDASDRAYDGRPLQKTFGSRLELQPTPQAQSEQRLASASSRIGVSLPDVEAHDSSRLVSQTGDDRPAEDGALGNGGPYQDPSDLVECQMSKDISVEPPSDENSTCIMLTEEVTDKSSELSRVQKLEPVLPALAMALGTFGILFGGVSEGLEVVGFTTFASFLYSELLWAESRKSLQQELSAITDRSKLLEFLKKRNIFKTK